MPDLIEMDARLARLEAAVAELARKLETKPPEKPWWEQMAFKLDTPEEQAAFDEMVALGRQFRNADRPPADASESA